jgi:glycerol-3-phosphate dehydrogenase
VPVADLLRREPALNRGIRRAFRVPDGSLEPWQLIQANLADARAHGSEAWAYHRVVAIERSDGHLIGVDVADVRTGSVTRLAVGFIVSAAGAWAGQIAALAGVDLAMSPGKGTMLIYNQRMTDTVINRCHQPGDGDIMVPVHTVAILGTTEIHVDDPDDYEISREEVAGLVAEGAKLFPDLPRMRILRAYAGVRPLYQQTAMPTGDDGRAISRAHAIIDHGARDGVDNLVSIVGGKLTTYRLMAEQTADVVIQKLGVSEPCTTAHDVLPGQEPGHTYWLGHRLAEHEQAGGGDADLVCECELVTRSMVDEFLDANWPCSLDDLRRWTRLGMGPCQGGFCAFRAAGIVAQRIADGASAPAADSGRDTAAVADQVLRDFLRERFKGSRPIASGRQLQELWMISGIYSGVLGIDSLPPAQPPDREREESSRVPR